MFAAPQTTDPPLRLALTLAQQRIDAMRGWAFVHVRVVRKGPRVWVKEDGYE